MTRTIIRVARGLLALFFFVGLAPAWADNLIYLRSEPGDFAGGGVTRTYTVADGTFSAGPNFGDYTWGVKVQLIGPNGSSLVGSEFAAPNRGLLTPGDYPVAQLFPFQSPTAAGMRVGSNGGCNSITGHFHVHEIVVDGSGVLQAFAVDFEQHCEGAAPALYGSIRYQSSVPLLPAAPIASARAAGFADPGQPVLLDGSASRDPNGAPLTYSWSQVSGTPVTIAGASNAVGSFVAPAVPVGGSDLVFELRVSNSSSSSTTRVTTHVSNAADPKTLIYLKSEPGEFVLAGATRTYTLQDGEFFAVPINGDYSQGVSIRFNGGSPILLAEFVAPQGQRLTAGEYPVAQRFPFQGPGVAGLSVAGGCNTVAGRFYVHEMIVDSGGVLRAFAVDFEQHCDGQGPALLGSVRYKSVVPLLPFVPIVTATAAPVADPGQTVTLDGSNSRDANGLPLVYSWTQVSGTPAVISGADRAVATFVAPTVPAGGSNLVFELVVTNGAGRSSVRRVTVHVALRTVTSLQVTGQPPPAYTLRHMTGIPLSVLALDASGRPVAFTSVTFAVQGACATVNGGSSVDVMTDANGVAIVSNFATLEVSGMCVTRASIPNGPSVNFQTLVYTQSEITLVPYPAATIATVVNQTFQVGVTVLWQGTVPIVGPVTFERNTPSSTGPGLAHGMVSATTDSNGRAIASLVANGVPGTYMIRIQGAAATGFITVNQSAADVPTTIVPQVQDMWWAGPAENGWGMSLIQHGETIFATIYGYDAQGAATWYVMPGGSWNAAKNAYTGSVYVPRGSPFFAYDAARYSSGLPVGTMTITFGDAEHATLSYTIYSVTRTRSIERNRFALSGSAPLTGLGDMWWGGPSQNGWGTVVLQQFGVIFSVWFTYDANGVPTWYFMSDGRWSDATTYEGALYRTTGSPWLAPTYDPNALRVTPAGTFRYRFNGSTATFDYTVDGRSGSVPLERLGF